MRLADVRMRPHQRSWSRRRARAQSETGEAGTTPSAGPWRLGDEFRVFVCLVHKATVTEGF